MSWLHFIAFKVSWTRGNKINVGSFRADKLPLYYKRLVVRSDLPVEVLSFIFASESLAPSCLRVSCSNLEQETRRQRWTIKLQQGGHSELLSGNSLRRNLEKDKRTKEHWLFGLAQQWKWKGRKHTAYSNFLKFMNRKTPLWLFEKRFLSKFRLHCGTEKFVSFLRKQVRTRVLNINAKKQWIEKNISREITTC